MNWSNIPIVSPFSFYIPPEAKWLFYVVMITFIVAIHIHAINRD